MSALLTRLAVVFTSASLLSGCGAERENDIITISQDQLDATLTLIVDQQLIPDIQDFASSSDDLLSISNELCETTATASADQDAIKQQLQQAQSSWQQTTSSWHSILPFLFGPLDDDILIPEYQFIDAFRDRGTQYLNTVRSEIINQIQSGDPLNRDFYNNRSFSRVGLLALE